MSAKLFATVNTGHVALVLERPTPSASWELPGNDRADLVRSGPGMYSLVRNGRSFNVLVLKEDLETGVVRLRIGSHVHTVRFEDERSRLMQVLGMDKTAQKVVRELKAPMPGLVLKLLVKEGDVVKKNDPLLVLEAMKMENVIKSPGDATVKQVHVAERTAVEKGQLLLSFE
ncbi:MAG: biotin/lipoyl-containing protein [Flavobacteriales bacterium]